MAFEPHQQKLARILAEKEKKEQEADAMVAEVFSQTKNRVK